MVFLIKKIRFTFANPILLNLITMKKIYLLLLLSASLGFAQIPVGYYSTATGTGYTLKTQLKKIIDNVNDGLSPEYIHRDSGYGSGPSQSGNGLWSGYGTTDRDMGIGYDDDNTIVDIYTEIPGGGNNDIHNFNFNTELGANEGQCGTTNSPNYSVEGDCYNREHLIPQSYFGSTGIMRNDIQHVYPTDGKVNAIHNDWPFGKVNVASYTSTNGSKLGTALNSGYSAGFSGIVFEPADEFKGDVARVYLYFATRYEDQMSYFYNTTSVPPFIANTVDCRVMFDGSSNKVFSPTFLNILLTWNAQDPVSVKETKRNNAAYVHQGNRNPFIDNNSYVTAIWGLPLSTASFELIADINIYPNPSNNQRINIETENELDDIQLININGQIMQEIKKPSAQNHTYTLENLPKGFYFLKLSADSRSITKKIIIN
ncbi:putative extracellular ribonuclease [Flavobacterium psychrophilum]|nr:putative extracellular ribonuclease [Flavobacterium psychrophilum]